MALVPFAALPNSVAEDGQRARGGDSGVQLPDGTRRQVPRVCVRPLPLCLLAPVELLEPVQRYVDLASRLQYFGIVPRELLRDGPDSPQAGRDVLADGAVASCGAPREEPVLVAQRDREAVYLEFANVARLLVFSKETADAGVPLVEVFKLAGVRQREHRYGVADLLEPLQRFATYPLRRGVGGDKFGVLVFKGFEFFVESVVLGVGYLRDVLDVVAAVMMLDQPSKILDSDPYVQVFGHEAIIRASGPLPKEALPKGKITGVYWFRE